jgi:hypothetical protein
VFKQAFTAICHNYYYISMTKITGPSDIVRPTTPVTDRPHGQATFLGVHGLSCGAPNSVAAGKTKAELRVRRAVSDALTKTMILGRLYPKISVS